METKRAVSIPVILLFAVILVAWCAFARYHAFDDDEFQHAHFSWLIGQGHRPYLDFFEHHIPAYHALMSPIFAVSPEQSALFLFRVDSVFCGVGTVLLVYLICRRASLSRGAGLVAACLMACAPLFLFKMTEARPESPAILCFALAWYLLQGLGGAAKRNDWIVFSTGILTGLMVVLSQKYIFAAAGLFAYLLVVLGPRRIPAFVAGAAIPPILVLGWLAAIGSLPGLFESVIGMNMAWKYRFSPVMYLSELFESSSVLVVGGCAGIFAAAMGTGERRQGFGLVLLLAGAAAGVFIVPVPYRQVFLPLLPVLAVGTAFLLDRLIKQLGDERGVTWAMAVLVVVAGMPGFLAISKDLETTAAMDLQKMEIVHDVDPSGGPVFDGRALMFNRPHVGRYGFMHEELLKMLDLDDYAVETTNALARAEYPTVIMDYRVRQMPAGIQSFIVDHYRRFNETDIYVPGLSIDRLLLAGAGTDVAVPVSGVYRLSCAGGKIKVDGAEAADGTDISLQKGMHRFSAEGFVENVELMLIARQE